MTATTGHPPVTPYAVTIPPQLRSDEFRFILLPSGSKGGEDNERGWNTTANYAWNDPRVVAHLQRGGNYGVFPAEGSGITILDADDYAGCLHAGLLTGIKGRTFTVETGGSRSEKRKFHFYFRCLPPFEGKFPLHFEGRHIGEIYCQHPGRAKGYVVGPDSVHPSGERYRVDMDMPIATIDRVDYAMQMSKLAREKRRDETREMLAAPRRISSITARNNLRCADFLMPNNWRHRGEEIEGEHPVHGSSTGTNLTLSPDNTWWCRACESGGGPLEALAVAEGIIGCREAGPGCLEGHWHEVFDALRRRGYDVDSQRPPEKAKAPAPGNDDGDGNTAAVQVTAGAPSQPKKKAKELPPFTYRHPRYGLSVDIAAVADHLYESLSVVSFNRVLYIYEDGIYHENKGQIEAAIKTIVTATETNEQLTRVTREVLAHLVATMPYTEFPFNQAPNRIPVKNGVVLIDYETGDVSLLPHSPEYRFTYKLPVVFDPDADGEAFHTNVIATYVDEDETMALYQLPAQALLQAHGDKPYKRAYVLHGDANGGKSTYIEILTALFGAENIAGASLYTIGTDRFINSTLEGKLLNACDDLEDIPLKNIGPFKTLTGIFNHKIERKHANPYQGRITCPHVFTCNQPPEVPERFVYDDAFWVRWIYLHFDNVFPVDPGFNAKWITPENLSGFFNRVILVMKLIKHNGLLVAPDASETKQAWTIAADPFAQFVAAEMRAADNEQIFNKEALLKSFIRWCEANNIPSRKVPTTINALSRLTFKNGWRTVRKGKDWQYGARKQWNSGSLYAPTKDDEAAGANRTL